MLETNTTTYSLTKQDIEEAIINHMERITGKVDDKDGKFDIKFDVEELTETYWISNFETDTTVVGHNISAKVELIQEK